jgi:hypothetical protein
MNNSEELRAAYFVMLASFRSTLTSADERMVFEEAIIHDFKKGQYEDWLLQTGLKARSRDKRLRILDTLIVKLTIYVESISPP